MQIAKNRDKVRKNAKSAQKCEKSRKKLVKSGNLWDDRQVMGCQVIGGCTVKSTAGGRNRVFKGVEKWGKKLGVKIEVFINSVSFFEYLTFSTIIPFPKLTKKMAWVSPIFPRADRPELLTYY